MEKKSIRGNSKRLQRKKMSSTENERPDYQRGISIVVYSMNGGPIPTKAVDRLKREAQEVAQSFPAVAVTVVED